MRVVRQILRVLAVGFAAAALHAATAQESPPGPVSRDADVRYAVMLSDTELRAEADASSDLMGRIDRGGVVVYLGATDDVFGRPWHILGDPYAWERRESWLVTAFDPASMPSAGEVVLLTAIPEAAAVPTIPVGEEWWREGRRVAVNQIEGFGEVLGVAGYEVPATMMAQMLELVGGIEALGPWPEEPAAGQLHVARGLPVVFEFDGNDWKPSDPPFSLSASPGLLSNPSFATQLLPVRIATGVPLDCWTLAGALDPRGGIVAGIEVAPPPPARLLANVRRAGDRLLGYFDLGGRAWPSAPPEARVPRPVVAARSPRGVLVNDNSRRQAGYLEQTLSRALTARLRGRTVRLDVLARTVNVPGAPVTITVGLEIVAGSTRESLSATVGLRPTPIRLQTTVPDDAETLTVRLIPLDRSIAVQERGQAIFDQATLSLAEWPVQLEATTKRLQRVRIVGYEPARRYARGDVIASDLTATDLQDAWVRANPESWTSDVRASVLAGQLRVGMPQAAVELAWGEPEARSTEPFVRWEWTRGSAAFDAEGRLTSWTERPERTLRRAALCMPGLFGSVESSP